MRVACSFCDGAAENATKVSDALDVLATTLPSTVCFTSIDADEAATLMGVAKKMRASATELVFAAEEIESAIVRAGVRNG